MSMAKVQQAAPAAVTAASATTTFGATPALNNLLVAVFRAAGAHAGATPAAGWTAAVTQDRGATVSIGIYYRIAGPSEPTGVTFNYSSSVSLTLEIFEFTGNVPTLVLDKTASTDGGVSTRSSLSSGTTAVTSQANEIAVAAIALEPQCTSWTNTWTNGFVQDTSITRLSTAHRFLSSAGSVETTETWVTARVAAAAIATFKGIASFDGTWGTVQIN